MTDTMRGTILRIPVDSQTSRPKGFGFIRGEDGLDYFFHATEVQGDRELIDLQAGESVTFLPAQGPKGLRANNVEPDAMPARFRDSERVNMRTAPTRGRHR